MAVIGPNFPKCPVCGKDMESVSLSDVSKWARQEMVRYNRYQKLDPNFWYGCKEDRIHLHKLAVQSQ